MKRTLLALILLVAAHPAIGQDEGGEAEPAEVEAPMSPAVDQRVVEKGDTLWGLCKKELGSPWLWPKIWSYNPEITNPNWIYPGDIVRFFPADVELPRQAELIAGVREIPQEEEKITEEEKPGIEVIQTAKRERRPPDISRFVGLFVTEKELAESGVLSNAPLDKLLLTQGDTAYVKFPEENQPQSGAPYLIYRTLAPVVHPISKKRWGYMTQVTGTATMESRDEKIVRARIRQAVVEIERGQLVTPMTVDPKVRLVPSKAKQAVDGYVLAIQYDAGVVAGQNQIIFVDKGKKDGIERGNELRVMAGGDPITHEKQGLPTFEIANLVVVDTNETASTCLVLKATREIEAGDRFKTATQ